MRPHLAAFAAFALAALAASCAGYRLGDAKPARFAEVRSIHVPLFRNDTLEPRVESLATNETVAAFNRDGTYRVTTADKADAILEGKVVKIDYAPLRTSRTDTLRPFELRSIVHLQWTLKDANNPVRVIDQGLAVGSSNFFLDPNVQTSRTNALPDAVHRAARTLVSRLADGF